MIHLTAAEIGLRFLLAAGLTTALCVPLGLIFRRTTGVPPTYPPLSPAPLISGAVGGALLVTLGYCFLTAVVADLKWRAIIFVSLGCLLTVVSFYLPSRLSYTKSLRFTGVTPSAQIAQGLLHIVVVGVSMLCFLRG